MDGTYSLHAAIRVGEPLMGALVVGVAVAVAVAAEGAVVGMRACRLLGDEVGTGAPEGAVVGTAVELDVG